MIDVQVPLAYVKMDAQGNDFIFLDAVRNDLYSDASASESTRSQRQDEDYADREEAAKHPALSADFISRLSSRDSEIGGCDQLIICEPPTDMNADFFMRVYNSDGSESEQCGNAARCFVYYVRRQGLSSKDEIILQTAQRNLQVKLLNESDENRTAITEADMGAADFTTSFFRDRESFHHHDSGIWSVEKDGDLLLEVTRFKDGLEYKGGITFYPVSFGNPHLIHIASSAKKADELCDKFGEELSQDPHLYAGANIGFVAISQSPKEQDSKPLLELYTYERGAGKTLACGSNACAAFAVAHKKGHIKGKQAQIKMRGGSIVMRQESDGNLIMTGEITEISSGILK